MLSINNVICGLLYLFLVSINYTSSFGWRFLFSYWHGCLFRSRTQRTLWIKRPQSVSWPTRIVLHQMWKKPCEEATFPAHSTTSSSQRDQINSFINFSMSSCCYLLRPLCKFFKSGLTNGHLAGFNYAILDRRFFLVGGDTACEVFIQSTEMITCWYSEGIEDTSVRFRQMIEIWLLFSNCIDMNNMVCFCRSIYHIFSIPSNFKFR